jgi:glycerate-2-kinase
VIATSHNSLITEGNFFRSKSIPTVILSATAIGEASYVAKVYVELAYEIANVAIRGDR